MQVDDIVDYAWKGVVIAAIIFVGYLIVIIAPQYYQEHEVVGKVLDKERVVKDQDSYYLIHTDNETFKITDNLIKGQWHSSDIYGHIEKGQTYRFTVFGWRSGFFSMYRNITTADRV